MNLSIRMKIVLITVAILALVAGMNTVVSTRVFTSEYSHALQSETLVIGQGLRLQLDRLLRLGLPVEELVGFEKQCQETVDKYEAISYAMVVDTGGEILFHNDPSQHGRMLSDPAELKAVDSTEEVIQVLSKQGEKYYDITIPVLGVHGERVAAVKVGYPVELVSQKTGKLLVYSVGVTVVSLALAVILLLFLLSAWVTNPLMKLLAAIRDMRVSGTAGLRRRVGIDSNDEIGQIGTAFDELADQLQETLAGLAARSRAMETSAEVSRRLSTILDQEQLMIEVVDQVQGAFNYYHVHIYLVDEPGEYLVMAGGSGETGRAMLAGGYKIPWGKGLVGRAAETNAVVLAPDVSQQEGWLPNRLLPDTRAEVAVPITVGERVVGVLDVQHDVAGGLGQDDADLLSSIAGQVAVALQNTRMFAEARQKAEQEARANLIVQRIQSTNTVESALQVAIRELGRVLEAQETSVRLGAATRPGNGQSNRAPVGHGQAGELGSTIQP